MSEIFRFLSAGQGGEEKGNMIIDLLNDYRFERGKKNLTVALSLKITVVCHYFQVFGCSLLDLQKQQQQQLKLP